MRICKSLLIISLFASPIIAQESSKPPLSGFDKLAHSCDDAASIIDSERKRLGPAFEKELMKYLGDDVEKHYSVACHISSCCTHRDDTTLELLSLMIKQQALSMLRTKKDDHSLYAKVSLHVASAVQSEQLGFHVLAIQHKSEVNRLVSVRPILKGGYPAMTKDEWRLYDSLPLQPQSPKSSKKSQLR